MVNVMHTEPYTVTRSTPRMFYGGPPMDRQRQQRRKGFTLVEILIVVVILGILAAIVIPQFTNASESAKASSLLSQLSTLRSQLELYKVQHKDEYPTGDGTPSGTWDWSKMTGKTNADGGSGGDLGPYLPSAPTNPFTGSSSVASSASSSTGWVIDSNGNIFAVGPDTQFPSGSNDNVKTYTPTK